MGSGLLSLFELKQTAQRSPYSDLMLHNLVEGMFCVVELSNLTYIHVVDYVLTGRYINISLYTFFDSTRNGGNKKISLQTMQHT